ncbi:MAG: class I SAM-dependent methyltransferase [Gammaproteobacteria bacterium]|nr:class I SAM-dependent methyltransferase [Gammaproteobacteria bacterium]
MFASSLARKIENMQTFKSIGRHIQNDHAKPVSSHFYLHKLITKSEKKTSILDLGCGEGNSYELFSELLSNPDWHGVDIEDSPEVRQRKSHNLDIQNFNGVNLPYEDKRFDIIYCNQVLEHVRHPDQLIQDAFRVMKPGSYFIGSVSQLEPYHSYSIFNFTPYGISQVFEDAGFNVLEIRPGSDAYSLISRQLLNRRLKPLWNHNLLHGLINIIGWFTRLDKVHLNFLKLQFSGHLVFLAKKADHNPNKNDPI